MDESDYKIVDKIKIDTIKICTPDFDCDINGVGDSTTATDHDVCTIPENALQPDFQSSQY